ncbi:hypothetical protein LPJ61_006052, partial [Coemansia biformis]
MGVLGACRDVTSDAKTSYKSCMALRIGSCDESCDDDGLTTEQCLTVYIEWLASSDAAARIDKGETPMV